MGPGAGCCKSSAKAEQLRKNQLSVKRCPARLTAPAVNCATVAPFRPVAWAPAPPVLSAPPKPAAGAGGEVGRVTVRQSPPSRESGRARIAQRPALQLPNLGSPPAMRVWWLHPWRCWWRPARRPAGACGWRRRAPYGVWGPGVRTEGGLSYAKVAALGMAWAVPQSDQCMAAEANQTWGRRRPRQHRTAGLGRELACC